MINEHGCYSSKLIKKMAEEIVGLKDDASSSLVEDINDPRINKRQRTDS